MNVPHPLELGQGVDCVLDGVGGDDVRVVSLQVILAWPERELDIGLELDDGVATPLSPDDQHLHRVFAVARPHELHILHTGGAAALDSSTGLIMRVISRLLWLVLNNLGAVFGFVCFVVHHLIVVFFFLITSTFCTRVKITFHIFEWWNKIGIVFKKKVE